VVREHTPEELAEVQRILKEAEPLFEARNVREIAERERWAGEIALLERRVRTEYVEVDLGNGDTIALRACLSEAEGKKIQRLEKERTTLDLNDPKTPARMDEIAYEILEIVTANPLITKEWLKKNRDRFAVSDMLAVTFAWYEQQADRVRRINSLRSFRPDRPGPELRRVSPSHEDPGPPGLGGSP